MWRVYDCWSEEDTEDDCRCVSAECAEDAAKEFAEANDNRNSSYPMVQTVFVKNPEGTVLRFIVNAYQTRAYTADLEKIDQT